MGCGRRSGGGLCAASLRADVQILTPCLRFRGLFDGGVAFDQEGSQVPAQEQLRSYPSERPPRCDKVNLIAHARTVVHGCEVVIMLEAPEDAGDHHVTKVAVRTENPYPACVSQRKSEVTSLERHGLPFTD